MVAIHTSNNYKIELGVHDWFEVIGSTEKFKKWWLLTKNKLRVPAGLSTDYLGGENTPLFQIFILCSISSAFSARHDELCMPRMTGYRRPSYPTLTLTVRHNSEVDSFPFNIKLSPDNRGAELVANYKQPAVPSKHDGLCIMIYD